jgi:Flp pilus assembly protein TadD
VYLRRAARLAPREPEILWHLGELHLARGERKQALTLLERARALRPDGRVRARIEARLHSLSAEK